MSRGEGLSDFPLLLILVQSCVSNAPLGFDCLFNNFANQINHNEQTHVLRWHRRQTCHTSTIQKKRKNWPISSTIVAHFALLWLYSSVHATYTLKFGTRSVQFGTYTVRQESLTVHYNPVIVHCCLHIIRKIKILNCTFHLRTLSYTAITAHFFQATVSFSALYA